MYIFKYINKNTGELIGYHLSTFCQVGPKESAKRYQCKNGPEEQMEVIRENVKHVLNIKDSDEGIFSGITKSIKKNDFKGLSYEEVELEAEYLIDGVTPDDIELRVHTIISNGKVNNVNIPIEDIPKVITEIHQSKNN